MIKGIGQNFRIDIYEGTRVIHRILRLALLIVILSTGIITPAQEAPPINPALVAHLENIERLTANVRQLTALNPVERRFPSRQAVIDYIVASLDEQITDDVLAVQTHFYRAFDFIRAGVDLRAVYSALLAGQVAGYYDPDTQTMNVVLISGEPLGDSLPLLDRITYAHEFVHALQDQHFDLGALLESAQETMQDDADAALALQALIEGDATLVMQQYALAAIREEPRLALELLTNLETLLTAAQIPPGTPPILQAELTMPYLEGMNFVAALVNDGGWEAVNAAFAAPPTATAHILNPDLYLDGWQPVAVTAQPLDSLLGEDWTFILESTLGQFYLREYLAARIGNNSASSAASGWAGDRYRLYYQPGDDAYAWVMRVAWQDAAEAAEFGAAFARFADRSAGVSGVVIEAGPTCWQAEHEAWCALEQTDYVTLAYAPSAEAATAFIAPQE